MPRAGGRASRGRALAAALALGAPALLAAQEPGTPAELARSAERALELRCAACHVPESEDRKARRAWDGALDLRRTLAEGFVVPGDPAASDLWFQVEEGWMPPEDAQSGPLSGAEREVLHAWILAGAPAAEEGDAALGGADSPPASAAPDGSAAPGNGDAPQAARAEEPAAERPPASSTRSALPLHRRAGRWLGRAHVLSVHFPVALILAAALAELAGMRRRPPLLAHGGRFCVLLAAPAALLAAGLGWLNAAFGSTRGADLEWHRWLGIATAVLALTLALLARRPAPDGGAPRGAAYRALLFLAAAAAAATGHLGGTLVHGASYLDW